MLLRICCKIGLETVLAIAARTGVEPVYQLCEGCCSPRNDSVVAGLLQEFATIAERLSVPSAFCAFDAVRGCRA